MTVEQILCALSSGVSEWELLEEYPEMEKENFHTVSHIGPGLVKRNRC